MPRALKTALASLVVCGLISAALPALADADIDPASDVLLEQDVFLPYEPQVCPQLSDALEQATRDARKAGYPIQVALIGSPSDLGGAANMFGDAQDYARFLGGELVAARSKRVRRHPLLAVMPGGFGLFQAGPRAARSLRGLSVPAEASPDRLARAAIAALPRLARAAGDPIPAPNVEGGCSDESGGSAILIVGAPLALLLIAGVIAASRRFGARRGEV